LVGFPKLNFFYIPDGQMSLNQQYGKAKKWGQLMKIYL